MIIIHSYLSLVTPKIPNFSLFLSLRGIYFYKLNLLFQFTFIFVFYTDYCHLHQKPLCMLLCLLLVLTRGFHFTYLYLIFCFNVGNGMPVRLIRIRLLPRTDFRLSMQGLFRLKMPMLRKAVLMLHQV